MGDFSRWSFDPLRDFSTVLSQQGRVDTDSDRNELATIVARRIQAGMLDTVGRAVVPRETEDGFKIAVSADGLTIGCGRMYVDGLLIENHGLAPRVFDSRLAEPAGTAPIPFEMQPYQPFLNDSPEWATGEPRLVYVKVWNREITAVEDQRLIEKALGVDTTTRLQTVWQVKVLGEAATGVTCETPLTEVPGFLAAEPPAQGRLTSKTVEVEAEDNPCIVPPTGGYKGIENQLYRVEIHRPGGPGGATFKWSRDNATVSSRVVGIPALGQIVVESLGRDDLLRFAIGDWVEVIDDFLELQGLPGELRRIEAVDDATRTITLQSSLPAGRFPVDANHETIPAHNTRVRRWDQRGIVQDEAGNTVIDLDGAGAGEIPIPAAGTFIVLENGLAVAFDLDTAAGQFRSGDFWLIAARTADASIEILDHAPPLGIHAHYAKLAIVTPPDTASDCRTKWPPEAGGEECECTVCVTEESHRSGSMTLQAAVEEVKKTGGTICIGPGNFPLRDALHIHDAKAIRIRGQRTATTVFAQAGREVIVVEGVQDVTLEDFAVVTGGSESQASAITLRDSIGLAVRRMRLEGLRKTGSGISLGGTLVLTEISGCLIDAVRGITTEMGKDDEITSLSSLRITDNTLNCSDSGIDLGTSAVFVDQVEVCTNQVLGGRGGGIRVLGVATSQAAIQIANNTIQADGDGIVLGSSETRIVENDITGSHKRGGNGIVLASGPNRAGMNRIQILANRIRDLRGDGIVIAAPVLSGMIKLNMLASLGGGGIVMNGNGSARHLVVENNQLIGIVTNPEAKTLAGMLFMKVETLAVLGNTISDFARNVTKSTRVAIGVAGARRSRIAGNVINGFITGESAGSSVGVKVVGAFREVVAEGNSIQRRGRDEDQAQVIIGDFTNIDVQPFNGNPGKTRFVTLAHFAVANVRESEVIFTPAGAKKVDTAQLTGDVAVLGNDLESESSRTGPVIVFTAGGCRMNDNRVVSSRPLPSHEPSTSSQINAERAIVNANELRVLDEHGNDNDHGQYVLTIIAHGKAASVIGNLRSGKITLNGSEVNTDLNPQTN